MRGSRAGEISLGLTDAGPGSSIITIIILRRSKGLFRAKKEAGRKRILHCLVFCSCSLGLGSPGF